MGGPPPPDFVQNVLHGSGEGGGRGGRGALSRKLPRHPVTCMTQRPDWDPHNSTGALLVPLDLGNPCIPAICSLLAQYS